MDRGFTIWFTGLPGSGKTTLAQKLSTTLRESDYKVELLDGDLVRNNLSKGLGFTKSDRDTNVRRIGFVCNLLTRNGVMAIAAAVAPYREVRDELRHEIVDFVEVFVKCPLDVLVQRDTKGMYRKALNGKIPNFTGVSDPYEEPLNSEITVETEIETIDESLAKIVAKLTDLGCTIDP